MFYICEKCLAGCRTSAGEETASILGFKDGLHSCGGSVKVVTDKEAGAGPRMNDDNEERETN